MSSWATKYKPEEKQALFAAVIDQGMKVPAALRAAKAGELDGCDAFTMPQSTGYDLVREERERRADIEAKRAAREDPRAAVQLMVAQLLEDARALLEQMRQGETQTAERWEELRTAARAVGEIERVARAVHKDPAGKGEGEGDQGEQDNGGGFLAGLAAREAETPATGPSSTNPLGTQGETERATRAPAENTGAGDTRDTENAEKTENGVRVSADERSGVSEDTRARVEAALAGSV